MLIENTVKELINSGNKDPKPLTVWKLISSKNPLPEPILKMTRKEGIFYTPLSSIDTDSMPYKTFSNRVGEYKKIFSVSKKLKKTDSSGT